MRNVDWSCFFGIVTWRIWKKILVSFKVYCGVQRRFSKVHIVGLKNFFMFMEGFYEASLEGKDDGNRNVDSYKI